MPTLLNVRVDNPADQAIISLIERLIKITKADYYRAYTHWKWCCENTPEGSLAVSYAKRSLNNAARFFSSELFCTISPVVGDEYVAYMNRQIEEGHIEQFNPPEVLE